MNLKLGLVAMAALALGGTARAQCACDGSATRTADATVLASLLSDKMVCANLGNDTWQEHHKPGGELWDYKLGSDARDPSAMVGSYTINADNTVTYNYGTSSFSYQVCRANAGGLFTFCGPSKITNAKISDTPGLQSCGVVRNTAQLPASTAGNTRKR